MTLEQIKDKARSLGVDDSCDGYGKNGYYQVIDWMIQKFPDNKDLVLDNGEQIYAAYCSAF